MTREDGLEKVVVECSFVLKMIIGLKTAGISRNLASPCFGPYLSKQLGDRRHSCREDVFTLFGQSIDVSGTSIVFALDTWIVSLEDIVLTSCWTKVYGYGYSCTGGNRLKVAKFKSFLR